MPVGPSKFDDDIQLTPPRQPTRAEPRPPSPGWADGQLAVLKFDPSEVVKHVFPRSVEREIDRIRKQHSGTRETTISVAMAATDPEFAPGHDAVASDFYELGDLLRCSLAASLAKPAKQPAARKTTSISVRNREEVLRYANVLLVTFREVLEYDPRLHHNQTAPILRIEDPRYLEDVRAIVKHLTEFTAAIHNSTGAKSSVRKTDLLTRLLTSFVNSYAKSLGKVLAGLTGAAIVGFLYQAGVGKGVVEGIWAHLKLLK